MTNNTELTTEIEALDAEIAKLYERINELEDRKTDLVNQQYEQEREERTKQFCGKVYEVNENNAIFVQLRDYTKTTPIFDKFVNSNKEFLVFQEYCTFSLSKRYSLVVTRPEGVFKYRSNGLTATALKSSAGIYLSEDLMKY